MKDVKTFDFIKTVIENSNDKKSLQLDTTILLEKQRIKITVSDSGNQILLTLINHNGTESHCPLTGNDNVAMERVVERNDICEQQLCGIIIFAFKENGLPYQVK